MPVATIILKLTCVTLTVLLTSNKMLGTTTTDDIVSMDDSETKTGMYDMVVSSAIERTKNTKIQ